MVPLVTSATWSWPSVRRRSGRWRAVRVATARDVRYSSLCCRRSAAVHGRLPEWPKGTVCKTVGSAYDGSNPSPATTCGNGPLAASSRGWRAVLLCQDRSRERRLGVGRAGEAVPTCLLASCRSTPSARLIRWLPSKQLSCASPVPPGPVRMQLCFTVGPTRNRRNLWKPAIDATGQILGHATSTTRG